MGKGGGKVVMVFIKQEKMDLKADNTHERVAVLPANVWSGWGLQMGALIEDYWELSRALSKQAKSNKCFTFLIRLLLYQIDAQDVVSWRHLTNLVNRWEL